jgi:glutathione S-transferase
MDIPYTEQYVSYPDIASLLKSYGVPASASGFSYTLPAIYHPESLKGNVPGDAILSDSIAIAHHLDALYPSAPHHAFPEPKSDSEALWTESEDLLRKIIFQQSGGHGYRLLMPRIPLILDDRGAEYFIKTRAASHPQNLSPVEWGSKDIEDDWKAVEPSVRAYNAYLQRKRSEAEAEGKGKGPFLWGQTLSMGDIYLASILVWLQAAGEGRLERFMAIGEGDDYETSPIRDVWNAFEKNGWLSKQGEERVIHEQT